MRLSPLMIGVALIAAPAPAQDNNVVAANTTEVIATNVTTNEAAVDANAVPAQPAPEAVAQPTEPAPAPAPEKQSFPWGVLGLLGLVGLLGKRRRS
jgi:MYXO-CTERM domain-containing protein